MSDLFLPLTIYEAKPDTDSALSISFDVPESLKDRFRFKPGQYLTLKADINGEDVRRNYSIASRPDEPRPRIIVKRVQGGRLSNFINDTYKTGQSVDVMPPAGKFSLASSASPRHIIGFAAGSGVTPIFSMISAVLHDEPQSRATLMYGNRNLASTLMNEDIHQLTQAFGTRFQLIRLHSGDDGAGDPDILQGRLSGERFAQVLRSKPDLASGDVYALCGPGTMIGDMTTSLILCGIEREKVISERFNTVAKPRTPGLDRELKRKLRGVPIGGDASVMIEVEALVRGESHSFSVDPRESILGAAKRQGLDFPHACEAGICGTCRAQVLEGDVDMASNLALEADEVKAGFVLTCQGRAVGEKVKLDFPDPTPVARG